MQVYLCRPKWYDVNSDWPQWELGPQTQEVILDSLRTPPSLMTQSWLPQTGVARSTTWPAEVSQHPFGRLEVTSYHFGPLPVKLYHEVYGKLALNHKVSPTNQSAPNMKRALLCDAIMLELALSVLPEMAQKCLLGAGFTLRSQFAWQGIHTPNRGLGALPQTPFLLMMVPFSFILSQFSFSKS